MAKAKQQVWWLARDGCGMTLYVISKYPLFTERPGAANWMPKGPRQVFHTLNPRTFILLTGGEYKLRPSDGPRKVVFTPLGVKEVKS